MTEERDMHRRDGPCAGEGAMGTAFDLSVYLVTDRHLCGERGVLDTVHMSISGGASLVQLRDPEAAARELIEQARSLNALLRPLAIPLIVNDRVDVALAAGVAGVHLGQSDMSVRDARAILGPDAIIGLSVGGQDELAASAEDVELADYVGVGPFAATGTKADAGAAIGVDGLRLVREAVSLPVVAIGGIGAHNARDAILTGADGVAVVSALCAAADPADAARELFHVVETAREERNAGGSPLIGAAR